MLDKVENLAYLNCVQRRMKEFFLKGSYNHILGLYQKKNFREA